MVAGSVPRQTAARDSNASYSPAWNEPANCAHGWMRCTRAAFEAAQVFPPLVTRMLRLGEHTGALDGALNKVASLYQRDVADGIARLQAAQQQRVIDQLLAERAMLDDAQRTRLLQLLLTRYAEEATEEEMLHRK